MRFDVPEKLTSLLFVILLAVAVPWYGNLALVLLILTLRAIVPSLKPVSRVASLRFRKALLYFISATIVMIPLNGLLIREGDSFTIFQTITLSWSGLEFGLQTGMRLLALACSLLTFFGSTPIPSLAHYLHDAGLPSSMVITLLLTLHFLDRLPDRINQIFTAQEARGAPVRAHVLARVRSFFTILSPLILSSIVESIDRGMALELRGFRGDVRLSFGADSEKIRRSSTISIVFLLLSSIIFLWILYRWLLQ